MSHKKILEKAAKALDKDAKHYKKEERKDAKHHNAAKLKHHEVERKEALSASKDMKRRAKKAHE